MARKIDPDVRVMTTSQLRQEVMRLRTAFDKELNHTGNHRCWINLLAAQRGGEAYAALSSPGGRVYSKLPGLP